MNTFNSDNIDLEITNKKCGVEAESQKKNMVSSKLKRDYSPPIISLLQNYSVNAGGTKASDGGVSFATHSVSFRPQSKRSLKQNQEISYLKIRHILQNNQPYAADRPSPNAL